MDTRVKTFTVCMKFSYVLKLELIFLVSIQSSSCKQDLKWNSYHLASSFSSSLHLHFFFLLPSLGSTFFPSLSSFSIFLTTLPFLFTFLLRTVHSSFFSYIPFFMMPAIYLQLVLLYVSLPMHLFPDFLWRLKESGDPLSWQKERRWRHSRHDTPASALV